MDKQQNHILNKIQEQLNVRNWSLYRLAKESGITYSSLSSMFRKNTQPSISTLEKICFGLGISMSDFFEDNVLRVQDIYSDTEKELISNYRELDTENKKIIDSLCRNLHTNNKKR